MTTLTPVPGTNVFLDGYSDPVSLSNFIGLFGGDLTIGPNNDGAEFLVNGDVADDVQTIGAASNFTLKVFGDVADDIKFVSPWAVQVFVSGSIGDTLRIKDGLLNSFTVDGSVRHVIDDGGFANMVEVGGAVKYATIRASNGIYDFDELTALVTITGDNNYLSIDVATNERIKVLGGENNTVTVDTGAVVFTDKGVDSRVALGGGNDEFHFRSQGPTDTAYDGGAGVDTVHVDAGGVGTTLQLSGIEQLFIGGDQITAEDFSQQPDGTGYYIAQSGQEVIVDAAFFDYALLVA